MPAPPLAAPTLVRRTRAGIAWWTDETLMHQSGVVVAFSERGGGHSIGYYRSLNLAGHVGDDPAAVDANRTAFLEGLDLGIQRENLTCAEQVHGVHAEVVRGGSIGAGGVVSGGPPPLPATDCLVTGVAGVPLMLCFADCVPIVLVAPGPTACVIHAGWRGALAGIVQRGMRAVCEEAGCEPSAVKGYVGPHIRACHYEIDAGILSQFVNTFGTVARAESGGLDLGSVTHTTLTDAGVDPCNIACLGACTAEATDRFFSYRAESGFTGRHAALVCIAHS